ncbi:MAG: glycosyltransferase [Thermodesulfobacteriota bacterium]
MDITLAVVTYNAAACVEGCLESLIALEPHGGALEIIVVDGLSEDGTRDIVRKFADRVRLVENPGRTIASNRNAAMKEARHPYLAFTDADCVVPPHWLKTLAAAHQKLLAAGKKVAAVGGGNRNLKKANVYQRALGFALNSYIGSLGSPQGKIYRHVHPVPSLSCLNILYDRAALEQVGGFDPALGNMGEDPDMNYRLGLAGYLIYYIPDADVEHAARPNLWAWSANMYRYGLGRAGLMRKHRNLFGPPYLAALLFLPAFVLGAAGGVFWPWAWLVWLYFPAVALAGIGLAVRGGEPASSGLVIVILLSTHFFYAAGLLRGIIHLPDPPRRKK